ncbi:MAG: stage III sporulation AC/AD family protein [Clostridiales bacterium]|jgi:stage III sporulation protein AD|nr:stage III sporulation AC/AD family protein [Clostridiales bacterium]
MEIIKIGAIGIITAICIMILKDIRSDMAVYLSIFGGLIILLMVVEELTGIITVLNTIADKAGLSGDFLSVILKIVGLGFVIDFSAGVCEDTGNKSLAEKIVLGGKISIMFVALPIVVSLFELITSLL